MPKRVFELATELGVKSTAVVEKCRAEGLPVKNHMSTLSAGLEATIREWFSGIEEATTVQTTAPVDLEKVKTTKVRKSRAKAAPPPEEVAAATAVEEPPAAPKIEPAPTAAVAETAAPVEAAPHPARGARPKRVGPQELAAATVESLPAPPVAAAVEEAPAEPVRPAAAAPAAPVAEAAQPEAPAPTDSEGVRMAPGFTKPAEPAKPKPAATVRHVPKPAQLKGPKVVRVESPEPPSRPGRAAAAGLTLGDLIPAAEAEEEEEGGRRGRKGRRRSLPGGAAVSETEAGRGKPRTKRRTTGRGYEVETPGPHEWGDRDWQERQERLAAAGTGRLAGRARQLAADDERAATQPAVREPHRVQKAVVKEPVTVKDLSAALGVRAVEIIGKLMQGGVLATVNQTLDGPTAQMVALEFGVELTVEEEVSLLDQSRGEFDALDAAPSAELRPPVVAFLGHVDHGKTSLLDRIRKATVAAGEAGGITQHLGSYLYDDGQRRVTFLDTPGHEAFTAMRARGANMTDIVVLVVAADDGVMPQTTEAINHAKAAGVPIVVAVNKMDLPGVDVHKVLGQLAEKGLVPAEWGGDTEVVYTSATTGQGIEDLIEHLDYVAELRQLKARRDGPATGWVVEAEMSSVQGAMARLLIKSGTLRPGEVIVSGSAYGRVRTIVDATGRSLSEAGPGLPVEVAGLATVPHAGDRFFVQASISRAAEIAAEQAARQREKALARRQLITLENLYSAMAAGAVKELNVIIKADMQGSVDVLRETIADLGTSEVTVRTLHAAAGGITEGDVLLAEASNAIIVGFQIVADERARALAESRGVQIRLYRVIYDVTEDIRQALEGMLAPRVEEKHLGRVEVRQVFKISRVGTVAGCFVADGVIPRSAKVRLVRESVVVQQGLAIQSLRRGKEDVSESRAGFECGIKLATYDDLKVGDVLEAYETVEVSRTLEAARSGG